MFSSILSLAIMVVMKVFSVIKIKIRKGFEVPESKLVLV